LGDKMASRSGQKGTIGLIIPERDMPFTADGVRPDIIINPHAIPSRMTIGQLIETILGKVGCNYGGFGDCTAFANKGTHTDVYGSLLVNAGYHSSGNQILYNGMTGEQLFSDIYIGPTYYMRLKHMVKDKINYRARGPNTMLTRQSVQGRANDGGLRIGEMERDGILAHGCSGFLNESYMVRGDEYYMAVCNKTGGIAIYNPSVNLFYSPFADGPVKYNTTIDGKMNIQNISRFGRSFSIVRIPYTLKLLIQELQVMNIQMRIITEDNVDQLVNMSYSDNINQLTKETIMDDNLTPEQFKLALYLQKQKIKGSVSSNKNPFDQPVERPFRRREATTPPSPMFTATSPIESPEYIPEEGSPVTASGSPEYIPEEGSPVTASGSPAYNPEEGGAVTASGSPAYNPEEGGAVSSPSYNPEEGSPVTASGSPAYNPEEGSSYGEEEIQIKNPELKSQWDALSESDKRVLASMISKKKDQRTVPSAGPGTVPSAVPNAVPTAIPISQSILEVETPIEGSNESSNESNNESSNESSNGTSSGETKVIKM
jgi:hypothetical protein